MTIWMIGLNSSVNLTEAREVFVTLSTSMDLSALRRNSLHLLCYDHHSGTIQKRSNPGGTFGRFFIPTCCYCLLRGDSTYLIGALVFIRSRMEKAVPPHSAPHTTSEIIQPSSAVHLNGQNKHYLVVGTSSLAKPACRVISA
jgi:hypothetical protein